MVLGTSGGTAFGVLLAVVMVAGYVALWALWHFVFRNAPPDDHQQDNPPPSDRAAETPTRHDRPHAGER
jgi:hypothetical protein